MYEIFSFCEMPYGNTQVRSAVRMILHTLMNQVDYNFIRGLWMSLTYANECCLGTIGEVEGRTETSDAGTSEDGH